jgi:hypothetical protein
MSWSPESACWQGTSPKGVGLVNRRRCARRRRAKGALAPRVRRDPRARDAERRGPGKRSIDRWTAINGVDPLAGLRYTYVNAKCDK